MTKILAMACTVLLLSACGPHGEAQKAIKGLLNDPDSAKFSAMADGSSKGDVCGMVNAKNRMGGYVGDTPFFYEALTKTAAIVPPVEEGAFRSLWFAIRSGGFESDLGKLSQQCRLVREWPKVCGGMYPASSAPECAIVLDLDGSKMYEALKAKYDR